MRPVNHLNTASKLYPRAWQQVDTYRSDRGRGLPDWPTWCFMPMAAWCAIVTEGGALTPQLLPDVGRLAAIGTWRYSQGIYRFDDDARRAIADTVPNGEMPVEVLYRLPEWCIYIETPGMTFTGDALHGFFVHLEWDANTHRHELRFLLDCESNLIPLPLHIGKWTLTEAVDRALEESLKQARLAGVPESAVDPGEIAAQLFGLVSLLLYVCSDEPEIDDEREPGVHPQRARPTKTKKGWRLFPAKRPRIWTVGRELGQRLRAVSGDETGRTVTPHLRRAHWHGFWSGPRDGERRFGYKWLPPTVVGSGC